MPELPEVESVLRALSYGPPVLTGRVVCGVNILWSGVLSNCCEDVFKAELDGSKFYAVNRHGKYLIFTLCKTKPTGKKIFLIVHLRMTGRLYLVPRENGIARHTRMSLLLDEDMALRFDDPRKFGRVWLIQNPDDVTSGLGPDALAVDLAYFASNFTERRRQIKPLLLDQSFIAGIGNIYADEILFRSGIHPLALTTSLLDTEIERLYQSTIAVLSEAVEAHGANIDGVFKEGGFVVSVYGRGGGPCPMCGATIAKIRVGQRGTHFCPTCQPLRFKCV